MTAQIKTFSVLASGIRGAHFKVAMSAFSRSVPIWQLMAAFLINYILSYDGLR